MNSVLCPYLDKYVIVFFHDILIYSKNEEEHSEHLVGLFKLLRENKWYTKLNQYSFLQTKVHYLGHMVSKEGIAVYPKNIRAIMEWEASRNLQEVRSFTGLAVYYRRFIKKFSQIAYHIMSLERQGKKFECTEECATSFYQLKQLLTNDVVLKIEDLKKEFVVWIDACKIGLGGVLMQEGQEVTM